MPSEFQIEDLDLEGYLKRIDYPGALAPSLGVLEGLHLAHATRVPFENLDILLGRPIHLDMTHLQDKIVRGGRGGYCFEQNLLFAAALERVGFSVTRLAARVRYRTTAVTPLTHMALLVRADGEARLADVGFGAEGLLQPVPLGGRPASQYAWTYRVVEEGPDLVLQSLREGSWMDLYAFTLEPRRFVDYLMANHFTSTHPESRFVQTITAQLSTPGVRRILRNRELIEDRGAEVVSRSLADDEEILRVLKDTFGLPFPAGTRFVSRAAA